MGAMYSAYTKPAAASAGGAHEHGRDREADWCDQRRGQVGARQAIGQQPDPQQHHVEQQGDPQPRK